MNNLMGAYEWRSDTHPVQQVEHWMQIAKQYQEEIESLRQQLAFADERIQELTDHREQALNNAMDLMKQLTRAKDMAALYHDQLTECQQQLEAAKQDAERWRFITNTVGFGPCRYDKEFGLLLTSVYEIDVEMRKETT
jgi:chromosome segregation ATPase